MITDYIYPNMVRKSWKTHEKYIKDHKHNSYGYIKELFGTQCLIDTVFNNTKIQVLVNISDITDIDKADIPATIFEILKAESEWEWMDDYFLDIID